MKFGDVLDNFLRGLFILIVIMLIVLVVISFFEIFAPYSIIEILIAFAITLITVFLIERMGWIFNKVYRRTGQ